MLSRLASSSKDRFIGFKLAIGRSPVARHWIVVLAWRVVKGLGDSEATHLAAGVAYYALLSLFPLILGLLAIIGIVLSSDATQQALMEFVTVNLPGSQEFVEENVGEVVEFRGALGIGAIIGLLWTASIGFGAVARAVNRAWGVRKNRPFYIARPLHILMALAVGGLFLVSTFATSAIEVLTDSERDLGIPGQEFFLALGLGHLALRMVPWGINIFIFIMIYRFAPNCKTYWRYVWPGALVAAVLFELSKGLFLWYLDNIAIYNQVYGSVASIIVLMLWIYVSALILILGAQLSAEYSRLRLYGEAPIPQPTAGSNSAEVGAAPGSPIESPPR